MPIMIDTYLEFCTAANMIENYSRNKVSDDITNSIDIVNLLHKVTALSGVYFTTLKF